MSNSPFQSLWLRTAPSSWALKWQLAKLGLGPRIGRLREEALTRAWAGLKLLGAWAFYALPYAIIGGSLAWDSSHGSGGKVAWLQYGTLLFIATLSFSGQRAWERRAKGAMAGKIVLSFIETMMKILARSKCDICDTRYMVSAKGSDVTRISCKCSSGAFITATEEEAGLPS